MEQHDLERLVKRLLGEVVKPKGAKAMDYVTIDIGEDSKQLIVDENFNPRSLSYDLGREVDRDKDQGNEGEAVYGSTLKELARTIEEQGIINPPTTLREKDGRLFLTTGFRRYRAMILLQEKYKENPKKLKAFQTLRVGVHSDAPEDPKERMALAYMLNLVENEHRNNLTSYELGLQCKRLGMINNWDGKKIASSLQRTRGHIDNLLRLHDKLAPEILRAWGAGHTLANVHNLLEMKLASGFTHKEQMQIWEAKLIEKGYIKKSDDGSTVCIKCGAPVTSGEEHECVKTPRQKVRSAGIMKREQVGELLNAIKRADIEVTAEHALEVVLKKRKTIDGVWPVVVEKEEEETDKGKGKAVAAKSAKKK